MPSFIHNRAEHILAKNPKMDKSQAFAIATQQGHAMGKNPKGYGTPKGRKKAKMKYDTPKSYKKTANPGGLESTKMAAFFKVAKDLIPGGKADSKTDADFPDEALDAGEQVELEHTTNPALAREIARDHLTESTDYYNRLSRMEKAMEADEEAEKEPLKLAWAKLAVGIPTAPGPYQPKNQASQILRKAQKVGTPDDTKGPNYKPLNMVKQPKQSSGSTTSSSSSFKLGSVAQSFFSKMAFNVSQYSGALSRGGFRQTSGVRPIGEGVGAAYSMDPKLGGNAPPKKSLEKKAFRGSGFGATSSHGAWSGTGGHDASHLAFKPIPAASVMDPNIKISGERIGRLKTALMMKES